jgi:hypothetical protein
MNLTIHLSRMPRLRMCGITPPFPHMLHGFLFKCRTILLLLLYLQIYVLVLKHLGLVLKLDEKQIFMINTNKKSLQHGIRRHNSKDNVPKYTNMWYWNYGNNMPIKFMFEQC